MQAYVTGYSLYFVCSLVLYARFDFSENASPFVIKFCAGVQNRKRHKPLTFERSRSKFKVKTTVLNIFTNLLTRPRYKTS